MQHIKTANKDITFNDVFFTTLANGTYSKLICVEVNNKGYVVKNALHPNNEYFFLTKEHIADDETYAYAHNEEKLLQLRNKSQFLNSLPMLCFLAIIIIGFLITLIQHR